MASVTTTASGKTAPWWRSLNKLSQEQVVAAIVIVLLIVFVLALPGFATTRNISAWSAASPFSASSVSAWG